MFDQLFMQSKFILDSEISVADILGCNTFIFLKLKAGYFSSENFCCHVRPPFFFLSSYCFSQIASTYKGPKLQIKNWGKYNTMIYQAVLTANPLQTLDELPNWMASTSIV